MQLPSKFTHDAVRRRDRVYVADTGEGKVLELGFPAMEAVSGSRLRKGYDCGKLGAQLGARQGGSAPSAAGHFLGGSIRQAETPRQLAVMPTCSTLRAYGPLLPHHPHVCASCPPCFPLKLRELELFTPKEHVNTLAPTHDGKLWALLHNLGSSQLAEVRRQLRHLHAMRTDGSGAGTHCSQAHRWHSMSALLCACWPQPPGPASLPGSRASWQVDLASGKELRRIGGIGSKAHGLTFWQNKVLTLDSMGGALVAVDTSKDRASSDHVEKLWQVWPLHTQSEAAGMAGSWGAWRWLCIPRLQQSIAGFPA